MGSLSPEEYLSPPKPAPELNLPSGSSIKVTIIDCTVRITAPVAHFLEPPIPGHELMTAPCYSFLIEHSSGRKIVFDLGLRKDPENLPPVIQGLISSPGWNLEIEKNVSEILQENGVDVAGGAIEAVIWSHWHLDHSGDPSTFPGSTDLIVGPGMVDALLPGYPENPNSPLLETDVAGRTVKTIDFTTPLKLGQFKAFDFFGDGSFYLLDVPGHAIGHMAGLARTTSKSAGDPEDTFIFMGGDTTHHGGGFRPTEYLPLPKHITPPPPFKAYQTATFCPGHIFQEIHHEHKANEPFYKLSATPALDVAAAQQSVDLMQEFDAAENVFVIIAHDATLLGDDVGLPWFPHATINDWKKQGLATKGRWGFLKDFEQALKKT